MVEPPWRTRELERFARRVTWTVRANALAALAFGLLLLAWPAPTLTVAATVLGLWLLLDGATRAVVAVADRDRTQDRVVSGIRATVGVLLAIGGVLTIRHPGASLRVVVALIGAGLLLGGAVEVIVAAAERRPAWWGRVALGTVAVLAGCAVLAWPRPSLSVLAALTGVALTALGAIQLVLTVVRRPPR